MQCSVMANRSQCNCSANVPASFPHSSDKKITKSPCFRIPLNQKSIFSTTSISKVEKTNVLYFVYNGQFCVTWVVLTRPINFTLALI